MESTFPRIPRAIACDNEPSLLSLPHPNIRPGAVDHPQEQGMIERFHKELAKQCALHNLPPDKAVTMYNAALSPASGGGTDDAGGVLMQVERPDATIEDSADDVDSDATVPQELVPYDGRALDPGTLVYLKKPTRSHVKGSPWWHRLSKVIERIGRKSYLVRHEKGKTSKRVISKLKVFSIGEQLLKTLSINPACIELAMKYFHDVYTPVDVNLANFAPFDPTIICDRIWIGYPGLNQMGTVTEYILKKQFIEAYLVVPDIPCEHWYDKLEKYDGKSEWFGNPRSADHLFWIAHDREAVFDPPIIWWIAKFHGTASY